MEESTKKRISIDGLRKLGTNQSAITFLFCVLIASFFWLLNALTKEYSTTIFIPIEIFQAEESEMVFSKLPEEIPIEVSSHGFNLLSYKIGKSPETIELKRSNFQTEVTKYGKKLSLKKSNFYSYVSSNLPSDLKLEKLLIDSLYVRVEDLIEKKVIVNPVVSLDFERQNKLKSPILIDPDSILIKGPKSVLLNLTFIPTETKVYSNIENDISENLTLDFPVNVTSATKVIKFNLEVEKITEAVIEVPLTLEFTDVEGQLKLYPAKVEITYKVGLSDYHKIKEDLFTATININELKEEKERLSVIVSEKPEFIEILKISPEKVEYLLNL